VNDLRRDGRSCLEIGDLLGLSTRTLRVWCASNRVASPDPVPHCMPLGRPVIRSPRDERSAVLAVIDELGPATGLPTLRDCFPFMARAELEDLLRRYRRVWRLRHQHAPRVLRWLTPGAVWAMDYSEADAPIDGLHPYLLSVRDLASGMQLLWLPVKSPDADHAIRALRSLFALHGAPLVLKTDNGSPFGAGETQDFLAQSEVKSLFSPPRVPRYNGAAEAGIGSLKTRTERHAERAGHPGFWTLVNVAYALDEANATARPRGDKGPTPDELWLARPALSRGDRDAFLATVTAITEEIGRRDEAPLATDLTTTQKRAVGREAVRRALVEHGHLLFRRRRLPLTIDSAKAANNR
jgi:transposase InsO family protein